MNRTSLMRRLVAGTAGLMIGAAGALAFAAPAAAQDVQPFGGQPIHKSVEVYGEAECDLETETWTVTWTVTNTSRFLQATVTAVSSENVDGIGINEVVPADGSISGTETFPTGTESATLEVELKWAWQFWHHWFSHTDSSYATVELGECREVPPPPPPPAAPPALIAFADCDLLGIIIDNAEGEGEAVVTLTPNEPATHGHATGFSYEVTEENGEQVITIIADEGAGIEEIVAEDSDEPVELGPFAPGDALHTHAFEAFAGLEVTVALTVDGEVVELENPVVSWDDEIERVGIECEGAGGELPSTGSSTMLIAGGAVALLVVGGGLFLVARRRRVTFTV